MAVKLNTKALEHARKLIRDGKVAQDQRDDWSETAASAQQENEFLEKRDWDEYALWHLGVDTERSAETKGRFSFPYGDFAKVHRGGVIAAESRAAQNDHDDIAKAAKELLQLIDGD